MWIKFAFLFIYFLLKNVSWLAFAYEREALRVHMLQLGRWRGLNVLKISSLSARVLCTWLCVPELLFTFLAYVIPIYTNNQSSSFLHHLQRTCIPFIRMYSDEIVCTLPMWLRWVRVCKKIENQKTTMCLDTGNKNRWQIFLNQNWKSKRLKKF